MVILGLSASKGKLRLHLPNVSSNRRSSQSFPFLDKPPYGTFWSQQWQHTLLKRQIDSEPQTGSPLLYLVRTERLSLLAKSIKTIKTGQNTYINPLNQINYVRRNFAETCGNDHNGNEQGVECAMQRRRAQTERWNEQRPDESPGCGDR